MLNVDDDQIFNRLSTGNCATSSLVINFNIMVVVIIILILILSFNEILQLKEPLVGSFSFWY